MAELIFCQLMPHAPFLTALLLTLSSTRTNQICEGPFQVYPLSHMDVNALTETEIEQLRLCLHECIKDLCCQSFGLRDGACALSAMSAYPYDFINERPCTNESACSPQVCYGNMDRSCITEITHGGTGGNAFTFEPTFTTSFENLTRLSVFVNEIGRLAGFELEYGGSEVSKEQAIASVYTQQDCLLDSDEVITKFDTFETSVGWGTTAQVGITITTNKKVCGPFGDATPFTQHSYEGARLLYVFGRLYSNIDQFGAAFWNC